MGAKFSGGGATVFYDDGIKTAASGTTGTQRNEFEAAIKSVTSATTVGAVFIYDTSQDSDGGKWRSKCKGLSWFDEASSTTRSARSEFPAMALIVADNDSGGTSTVSIYDLDDVAAPLWMQFSQGGSYPSAVMLGRAAPDITSVTMLNGRLCVGIDNSGYGEALAVINFPEDSGIMYSGTSWGLGQNIANRNTSTTLNEGTSAGDIVNNTVNDVSATILEGAEIGALGLPIPTVAIASAGGVSVIHANGDVYDIGSIALNKVWFSTENKIGMSRSTSLSDFTVGPIPYADTPWTTYRSAAGVLYAYDSASAAFSTVGTGVNAAVDGAVGQSNGLTVWKENTGNPDESAVAYITSTYNTGYMVGDIRLAALSDSDSTNLVELAPDLTAYADLAASVADGWVFTAAATFDAANDEIDHTSGTAEVSATYDGIVSSGAQYVVTYTVANYTGSGTFRVRLGSAYTRSVAANGTYTDTITANGTSISFQSVNSTCGGSLKAVSVRLLDVDHSVKNNGLTSTGDITKTAVATSAELMAYSGFSASDYLSQAYNADFDFGTGDFSVMVWIKEAPNSTDEYIFSRSVSGGSPHPGIYGRINTNGTTTWFANDNSSEALISTTQAIDDSTWHQIIFLRRGGKTYLYLDSNEVGSSTNASGNLDNGSAILEIGRLGVSGSTTTPLTNGSLSLLRISATAPTSQQIKEIYDAEKPLFQAGAKCLLQSDHGSVSNDVKDLAFDKSTGLLTVAQSTVTNSAGVQKFRGLEMVETFDGSSHGWNEGDSTIVATAGGVGSYARTGGTGGVLVDLPALDVRAELNEGESKLPDDGKLHFSGVTTDGGSTTPITIGHIPVAEGEAFTVTAKVRGNEYNDVDGEHCYYEVTRSFYRDTGDAIDSPTSTLGDVIARAAIITVSDESTATMDFVLEPAAVNGGPVATTGIPNKKRTVILKITGVANKRMQWSASVEVQRISDKTYER
jgi:hypothetical protein